MTESSDEDETFGEESPGAPHRDANGERRSGTAGAGDPEEKAHELAGTPPTDGETPPAMPVWVKASLIAVGIVVVLVLVLLFAGGGNHGPGRHLPTGI